jgi:thymidylate kinase
MSGHQKNPRSTLVSFSGIDGAGKSTQISNLCASLHQAHVNVRLITFWDDVAKLKWIREGISHMVFRSDKGIGTPEAPIHRRDKNVRSPLMTLFRMAIYLVDAFSLRKILKTATRSEADVVIFDRYIYDELANLDLGNAATRFYLRGIRALVPRPDISFLLEADPAQAFARKPEYPLDFLHSNQRSYLRLSEILGGITVIPPMPIDEAKAEVVQYVFREVFARHLRRVHSDDLGNEEIAGVGTGSDGESTPSVPL